MVVIGVIVPSSEISFAAKAKRLQENNSRQLFCLSPCHLFHTEGQASVLCDAYNK